MNTNFYKNLGIKIKQKREEKGLTQQQLADLSKISLNFMGKIEVAFSKPSLDTLITIADSLNVEVSELCDFKNL